MSHVRPSAAVKEAVAVWRRYRKLEVITMWRSNYHVSQLRGRRTKLCLYSGVNGSLVTDTHRAARWSNPISLDALPSNRSAFSGGRRVLEREPLVQGDNRPKAEGTGVSMRLWIMCDASVLDACLVIVIACLSSTREAKPFLQRRVGRIFGSTGSWLEGPPLPYTLSCARLLGILTGLPDGKNQCFRMNIIP